MPTTQSPPAPAAPALRGGALRPAGAHRLDIALLPCPTDRDALAGWAATLPADCLARIHRLRHAADRARAVLAHAALRQLLSVVAAPATAIEVRRAPSGQPQVWQQGRHAPWRVSLSHSGGYVAIAVASQPVGIDLEDGRAWHADAHERAALASQCFSLAEQAAWAPGRPAPDAAGFLRTWTAKEAALKAIGLGASGPWQDFDVAGQAPSGQFYALTSRHPALDDAWVMPLDAAPDCPAALCVLGRPPARHTRWHWPDRLPATPCPPTPASSPTRFQHSVCS